MDTEAFWRVLDAAKDRDKPLDVADHLSVLPSDEILAFEYRLSPARRGLSPGRMGGRLHQRRVTDGFPSGA